MKIFLFFLAVVFGNLISSFPARAAGNPVSNKVFYCKNLYVKGGSIKAVQIRKTKNSYLQTLSNTRQKTKTANLLKQVWYDCDPDKVSPSYNTFYRKGVNYVDVEIPKVNFRLNQLPRVPLNGKYPYTADFTASHSNGILELKVEEGVVTETVSGYVKNKICVYKTPERLLSSEHFVSSTTKVFSTVYEGQMDDNTCFMVSVNQVPREVPGFEVSQENFYDAFRFILPKGSLSHVYKKIAYLPNYVMIPGISK